MLGNTVQTISVEARTQQLYLMTNRRLLFKSDVTELTELTNLTYFRSHVSNAWAAHATSQEARTITSGQINSLMPGQQF